MVKNGKVIIGYFNDEFFGTVEDIVDYGRGNYVFIIQGEKEIIIPFSNNFIDKVKDNIIYFKNVRGFFK